MSDIDHIPDPMRQLAELFAHINGTEVRYDALSFGNDVELLEGTNIAHWRTITAKYPNNVVAIWAGSEDEFQESCKGFDLKALRDG